MGIYIQKEASLGEYSLDSHISLVEDLINKLKNHIKLVRANIYFDYPAEPLGKKIDSIKLDLHNLKPIKEKLQKQIMNLYRINVELEMNLIYEEREFPGYIVIYNPKNSRNFCNIEFDIYPNKEIKGIRDFILNNNEFLDIIKVFIKENKEKIKIVEIYPSQIDYEENPESMLYFYSKNPHDLIKHNIKYLALKRRDLMDEKIRAYNENFLVSVLWKIKDVPENISQIAKIHNIDFSKGSVSLSSFKEEGLKDVFDYILEKVIIPGFEPLEDKNTISDKIIKGVNKTLK